MTHHTLRQTSGILPHQIVALGPKDPDDEKAFRAANATYHAVRSIEAALSLRWLGTLMTRRHVPAVSVVRDFGTDGGLS